VRVARSRSERLLRGFAAAAVVCGPVLALATPALGEDTTSLADPPPATTTTTAPGPSPLDNPPPATTVPPSTETPTQATDPTTSPPVTDLSLPPVTDVTAPPVSDTTTTAPTEPTTATTTATSTPSTTVAASPVAVSSSDPPPDPGSGAAATTPDTVASPKTALTPHDASLPLQQLVQPVFASPLSPPGTEPGALVGKSAVFKPMTDAAKTIGAAVSGALRAPMSPDNASSWGDLGSAAPRFGPWIILLAMAWLVRTVLASILADRTAGPRRRRWTLL
jgi:hypothetical protein